MRGGASTGVARGDVIRVERPGKTLRELALDKMREAILDGYFKPGDRLVERDLCERLGVSRTIVREVLRHLESEGLVGNPLARGPVVAETSAEEAWQIYEIRAALEGLAAHACALHADETVVAALEAHLADVEAAYAKGNRRAVLAATTEFYEVMFHASRREIALETVKSLTARINQLRALTIQSPGRQVDGPREMRLIVEAVRARDPAAAADAAKAHVQTAARIAEQLLKA